MAGSESDAKQAAPPVAATARPVVNAPGEEAAEIALAQLKYGEAPQIGLLGDTGTGKTFAAQHLLQLYLRRSPGSAFVIDDKGLKTRFEGQYRINRADLQRNPIDYKLGRVTVIRGVPARGELADVEEMAEVAWVRAGHGRKTLMLVDEMISGRETLSKNNQWRSGVTWYPRGFTGGRAPGVGNIWGAQSPQLVPIEPFDESGAIFCFRIAGTGLKKLRERDYVEGGADKVLPLLHGPPDDPPDSRGDFLLLVRGRPWNGKIYKFGWRGG